MRKHLLGIEGLSQSEIMEIIDEAMVMKSYLNNGNLKLNMCSNVSVCNLFYENSTRTRTSFENAAKFLGANAISIAVGNSSVSKGETLYDTVKTLEAIKNNILVIRHACSGVPWYLSDKVSGHIINAGDGMHEHPTQALLDITTMLEYFDTLKGLKVAIVGDIKHSRVARSNIYGLNALGAEVVVASPSTLMPCGIEKLGVTCASSVDEALDGADIVMGLRIQLERQNQALFPSIKEYYDEFGITPKRMAKAKRHAILLHPGPVNRDVEIASELIDGKQSKILEQVTNGLAVRMAIIKLLSEQK